VGVFESLMTKQPTIQKKNPNTCLGT